MKRGVGAFVIAVACGAGACASNVGAGDGGADVVTVDGDLATDPVEFQRRVARAHCEQYQRCPGNGSSLFASVEVCVAYWTSAGTREDVEQRTRMLVGGGRVRYDADAARRCIEALGSTCFYEGSAACAEVMVGAVPQGSACSFNLECAPGTYCDGIDARTAQCAGTCRPRDLEPGQSFEPGREERCRVEPGYYALASSNVCGLVRDGAPAGEGGQCGDVGESPGHYVRVGCLTGLVCSLSPGDPPRFACARPRQLGDECGDGVLCAPGLVCVRSRDGRTACRASLETQTRVEGGPCLSERTPDVDIICDALLGLRCTPEGRCERVSGSGGEGEPCVRGQQTSGLCAPGFACERDRDRDEAHCRRHRPDGAECPAGGESCRSGWCVDGRCSTFCI